MCWENIDCIADADAAGAHGKPTAASLTQPPTPPVKEEPNQTTLQSSDSAAR